MTTAAAPARRRRRGPVLPAARGGPVSARERGALTLMLAILFVGLLAMVGVVVDGGAKLDADQKATAVAQEAARAGAGMVNIPRAYAAGTFSVSPTQAISAARQYLQAAGYPGSTVRPVGSDAIEVTVTISQPTVMLSLIGIDSFTVHGTATANLVTGVTGPAR